MVEEEYSKRMEGVHDLRKGRFVIFDGEPCRVINVTFSAPGKHGHSKAKVEAVGIFDGKKRVNVMPGHDKLEVPVIEKKGAQVLSVRTEPAPNTLPLRMKKVAQVMNSETYEVFDIDVPEELEDKVVEGVGILYWELVGKKLIISLK